MYPIVDNVIDRLSIGDESIYNITVVDTIYFNDIKNISLAASDILYDNFDLDQIGSSLNDQQGISNVTMRYTYPLDWYRLNLSESLNLDTLLYEINGYGDPVNPDVYNIKGVQQLKIGNFTIEKFNILLEGNSILLQIDEQYRYALSPSLSYQVYAQFYESTSVKIDLSFNNNTKEWELLSSSGSYFNVSEYLSVVEGDQFLFWYEVIDGFGNNLLSHKYLGYYDNNIQVSSPDVFSWALGTNSTGSGIILFGSDDYIDSTIRVNASSVLLDINNNTDVSRIFIYGSADQVDWVFVGRAYYSGEGDLWNYFWDGDLLKAQDKLPPENYFLKCYIFDKAGNYESRTAPIKTFDYTQIQLLTDLVFGEIFEYNSSSIINEQDITGEISNFFGTTNLWDIISSYYNPSTNEWIPMAVEPATIYTNGSYSITWDINKDPSFKNSIYNFSYGYLPYRVVGETSSDLWGSWGIFANDTWQPLIISDVASNIDISIYSFDNVTGWALDSILSNEGTIASLEGQVFKLWDIDQDGQYEIIRVSPSQIDVIYLDSGLNWVIKENVTSLSGYSYITFDAGYDPITTDSVFLAVQQNTANELSIWEYSFDENYNLDLLRACNAPLNFIPTSIKFIDYFTIGKAILIGGLIEDSYYSQLIEYDFNLNIVNILQDALLGKMLIIEFAEIDGIDSIILGVERTTIGKMDGVVVLRRDLESGEWIDYEISGFDDIRFEILDLMSIADDSINKLIIASKSGIFQTKIEYTLETHSIVSPICFTSEIYTKQELTPSSYPSITPKNIPVNHLTQVYYKLIGSNQWLSLGLQYARASKHEIRLDLSSVWSNLDYVRIAYGYDSFVSEERTAIDPSFQSYSGVSDTQAKSISATFFDTSALPLLWLNPGTKYSDPNVKWHSLPNAMSYQSSPVISGYGNRVFYPTITSGWDYTWGSEYTGMPELENSLINYGDSYNSGELAENLNSID
ncbi:MAG: hypothetical protein ACW99Q_19800, partial [Candidatus Kariarchaeaceae archaeon]